MLFHNICMFLQTNKISLITAHAWLCTILLITFLAVSVPLDYNIPEQLNLQLHKHLIISSHRTVISATKHN